MRIGGMCPTWTHPFMHSDPDNPRCDSSAAPRYQWHSESISLVCPPQILPVNIFFVYKPALLSRCELGGLFRRESCKIGVPRTDQFFYQFIGKMLLTFRQHFQFSLPILATQTQLMCPSWTDYLLRYLSNFLSKAPFSFSISRGFAYLCAIPKAVSSD